MRCLIWHKHTLPLYASYDGAEVVRVVPPATTLGVEARPITARLPDSPMAGRTLHAPVLGVAGCPTSRFWDVGY